MDYWTGSREGGAMEWGVGFKPPRPFPSFASRKCGKAEKERNLIKSKLKTMKFKAYFEQLELRGRQSCLGGM